MRRSCILFSLLFFLSSKAFSQVDSTEFEAPRNSIILAGIYGNNANYYGQTAEQRLPYFLSNVALSLKSGLFFSVGTYKLINAAGPLVSELDLTAGYELDLSAKWNASIAYSRSIFAKNSPLLGAANENTISTLLSYDLNFIKTGFSTYYAFGTQRDLFLSLNASKSINLGSISRNKDFISFEPGFEVVGGTLHYLEEYIVGRDRRENRANNPNPPPRNLNYTMTRSASSFSMISYNMNFLLGYNRRNYLLEAAWQVSSLGKNLSETAQKPRSFFNLSFYYQF
jgi:hypothetical protein